VGWPRVPYHTPEKVGRTLPGVERTEEFSPAASHKRTTPEFTRHTPRHPRPPSAARRHHRKPSVRDRGSNTPLYYYPINQAPNICKRQLWGETEQLGAPTHARTHNKQKTSRLGHTKVGPRSVSRPKCGRSHRTIHATGKVRATASSEAVGSRRLRQSRKIDSPL